MIEFVVPGYDLEPDAECMGWGRDGIISWT
jgi:hypothetical protein